MREQKKNTSNINPLKIMDTTLRDGHQSLLATRMRTEDMLPLLSRLNRVGFHAMEVWGGATFDVTHRFLNEDPWERLAIIKAHCPDTKLSMLLRGQNLVGYRNYADDVVHAFVEKAATTGVDIFRVFDALNDVRNFQAAFAAIKATGKHIQGSISYSITERKLGGKIFTVDYFVDMARRIEDMGANSLCIKDMAGLLSPDDATLLVGGLKQALDIPIQLHTHYTSGMASMTCLKAIEAGIDIIDCALAPFALRTAQPAVEPIVVALEGGARDTGLSLAELTDLGNSLEDIALKYKDLYTTPRMAVIDTRVLVHQIPGGMASNLFSQLKEADALDKLEEVYRELPKVRKEMGTPPLVTPTSQIVGTQAVMNVLFGRYKMVTDQVKDYFYGLYGTPPEPVDETVRVQVLKDYNKDGAPICCRPGDVLEPELDKAKDAIKDISTDMGDVLLFALYPTTGLKFLQQKYGLAKPAEKAESKIGSDCAGEFAGPGPNARRFTVHVDGQAYAVAVEETSRSNQTTQVPAAQTVAPKRVAVTAPVNAGATLTAPMPGLVMRYLVEEGQLIDAGDPAVILEAMKMENQLTAPSAGIVQALPVAPGTNVNKGDVILVIAEQAQVQP